MKEVVFITGNQNKADYLAKLIGVPIEHQKVELAEIQSLDVQEVVNKKLDEAFLAVGRPVLVEDTALEFTALGRLPGTFIKFFEQEIGYEGMCRLLDEKDRSAKVRSVFGYFDGTKKVFFTGEGRGSIALQPTEGLGFGWDRIYIPEGYNVPRAALSPEDDLKTYRQHKPIAAVREFLISK